MGEGSPPLETSIGRSRMNVIPGPGVAENSPRRDYDINGAVIIRLIGRGPVSDVIDQTLSFFRSPPKTPDLTLALEEYPSEEWVPTGTLVGDRFLYDAKSGTTAVLGERIQGTPEKPKVEYVVRGDLRNPGEPVTVFVPRVQKMMSPGKCFRHDLRKHHLRRALLAVAGNPFGMRHVVRQAERITEAIIEPFLYYRLPYKGTTLLHATSFCSNGKAALYAGSANIGKSTMAIHFAKENRTFLGDTLVVLEEGGKVLPYPGLIKLNGGHLASFPELKTRLAKGLGSFGTRLLMSEFSTSPQEALDCLPQRRMVDLFDGVTVPKGCEVDNVFLARRGSFAGAKSEEIGQEAAAQALFTDLLWEYEVAPWRNDQFICSSSAFAGRDFIQESMEHHSRVEEVVRRGISKAKCYSLSLPLGEPVARAIGLISEFGERIR